MKLGETITRNGIEAVLVEGIYCKECCFDGFICNANNLDNICYQESDDEDTGIFKQVEPK